MANLVKRTDIYPGLSSQTPTPENQIDGVAGEAIDYADLCYIGADGLFYRAHSGTALATQARGVAATKCRAGKPMTIYRVAAFGYTEENGADTAVPGKNYYVSATAGRLSDTAPTSGAGVNDQPVAFGRTDGNIHVICR
jgi:hypothetical protein